MFSMLPTPSAQFSIRFVLFICISHLYMYTQQAATLSHSICMRVCVCVLNLSLSHVWFAISHNQCWSSVGKSPKLPINLSYWLCLTANLLLLLLLLLQDGKRLQTELDSKSGKAPSILVSVFRYSSASFSLISKVSAPITLLLSLNTGGHIWLANAAACRLYVLCFHPAKGFAIKSACLAAAFQHIRQLLFG